MRKLKIYDKQTTYLYPNGDVATPERVMKDFPGAVHFPHIIEYGGNTLFAVMELGAMRNMHEIDPALDDEAAVRAIEEIINTPQPEPEPSPEERMAAAMEFQNLMSLPEGV